MVGDHTGILGVVFFVNVWGVSWFAWGVGLWVVVDFFHFFSK